MHSEMSLTITEKKRSGYREQSEILCGRKKVKISEELIYRAQQWRISYC